MSKQPVKVVLGPASAQALSDEEFKTYLDLLEKNGVKELDTAWIYPDNEKKLGAAGAPSRFTIHTKSPAWTPGALKKDSILAGAKKSLEDLRVDSVDTYYLHSPDPAGTPIEETLEAINELHAAGKFKHFGLSNFTAADVRKIYEYQAAHSSVLPTIYQGNYNPIARRSETLLLPVLRELGIAFYAYSPLAGGFLVKAPADVRSQTLSGRWDPESFTGKLYLKLYARPALIDALDEWEAIANEAGVSKAELAYRWDLFHSALRGELGDAVVFGMRTLEHLTETLEAVKKGPLPEATVKRVQQVWEKVEKDAPWDNYNMDG